MWNHLSFGMDTNGHLISETVFTTNKYASESGKTSVLVVDALCLLTGETSVDELSLSKALTNLDATMPLVAPSNDATIHS